MKKRNHPLTRILRETLYDLREPGIHIAMIPIVMLCFLALAFFIQRAIDASGGMNAVTLASLELLIPTLGGYGVIMLMQGLFDIEGGEIMFTYCRSNLYWGLIRQLRFFVLFILLVMLVCLGVAGIMHIEYSSIVYLTVSQSFAVMGISFLGITLSKKVSVALIILIAFVAVQFTLGREYDVLNFIYVLNGSNLPMEYTSNLIYNALIIGLFGWLIGQIWVRP